jgi:imidazolonepropionase-like amidohydrolase
MRTSSVRPQAILADMLIDGTGGPPARNVAVTLANGRITDVGAAGQDVTGGDRLDLRGTGWVLLPGLIDSHSHLWHFFAGDVQVRQHDSPAYIVARMVRHAAQRLQEGVTSTREVGTPANLDLGLRDAIAAGVVPGPRLFASGMGLAVTGGMYGKQSPFRRQTLEFSGADEARRMVRQQIDAGADFIKLYATAGIGERGHPQMTFDEVAAAVDEAHKAGRHVAAHAIALEGTKICVRAGVDTIEHGKFLDDEAVELMRQRGVVLIPTLAVGATIAERAVELGRGPEVAENARRVLDVHRRSVRLAYEAGVKIAAGTDPAYGDSVARECRLLVETALSPAEAVVAATGTGGDIVGRKGELGTVVPGAWADFVILADNPLEDIGALARVVGVVQNGAVVRLEA